MTRARLLALSVVAGGGVVVAVALGSSNDSSPTRTAAQTNNATGAQRAATPTRPARKPAPSATADRSANDPPPTRLVAGPLLFRLTGPGARAPADKRDGSAPLAYAVIFRLSRGGRKAFRDGNRYGEFLIARGGLDPVSFGRRNEHCFTGGAYRPNPNYDASDLDFGQARILDKVKLGSRVKVAIRPRTPTADGKTRLIAKAYVRHPQMRISDTRGEGNVVLTTASAKRAIRQMGCTLP